MQLKNRAAILAMVVVLSSPLWVKADLPSFPGADGAGAITTGGSGGVVYHVTQLDSHYGDNGPGTFQYGLNDSNFSGGKRTIVFDVGGTIWLGRNPTDTEGWDTQDRISVGSNITIAGQTAPGGIAIAGGTLKVNGSNTIIRNLTIAAGYGTRSLNSTTGYADAYVYDAMNIHATNIMIDHISTVFATDETISMDEFANNVTVQYSNISQGQNYPQADAENPGVYTGHALGSLLQPGSNALISMHHNLFAQLKGRLPRVGTESSKLTIAGVGSINDFRNNVFYNWLGTPGSGSSGQPSTNNFVGNFYLAGPGGDDTSGTNIVHANGGTGIFSGSNGPTGVYHSGNLKDINKDGDAKDGVALANSDFGSSKFSAVPYAVPYNGFTDSGTAAYNQVLNYVGANWQSRSAIDTRIVSEVRTGTGKITAFDDPTHGYNSAGIYVNNSTDTEWNQLLALRGPASGGIGAAGIFKRTAGYDTDNDGMPNTWETAHGLNPNVADNNGDYESNGYKNLDKYINEIAAFPASAPLVFKTSPVNTRYAELTNWTTGIWQPSRYDEAQINSGTAAIDVVGQHAGTLKIAANNGNTATLSVTAGWLDVAQDLLVGPGGTGTLTQTGGALIARHSIVIGGANNAGTFIMTGGILSTPLLAKGAKGGKFNLNGGTLHAAQVAFSVTNQGGTIAPGAEAQLDAIALAALPDLSNIQPIVTGRIGNTHINGSLTLNSGSLQIDLASLTSFDSLTVDSTLDLGGNLDIVKLNGYTPSITSRWKIGSASSISGHFNSITSGFNSEIVGGSLFLFVPEPSSLAILSFGLMLLTRRSGKKNRE